MPAPVLPEAVVPDPHAPQIQRTLEVDRRDFHRTRVDEVPVPEPRPGEAVLRIDRFALTANNITYAAVGDMLDYWGFFPAPAPWGRIPAMGFSTVVASASDELSEGGTYFGFHPMASHLVVEPVGSSGGFVDRAAHRSRHASAYRTYTAVESTAVDDTFVADTDTGDRQLLLRGLFLTSFLLDDHLAEVGFHGATTVVVTSASSKTALALAYCLSKRSEVSVVGLTSQSNLEFVDHTELYDTVLTYDAVFTGDFDATRPSVLVDLAGNSDLLADLHRRLGTALRFSSRVGGTHWDASSSAADLVGPAPEFFFAPTQISKRHSDWGAEVFESRSSSALASFVDDSRRWLTVEHHNGPEALRTAYGSVLDGKQPPHTGVIASMWPVDG